MKKKFKVIIAALGYTAKMKTGGDDLSKEELAKIEAKCQEELKMSFSDVLKAIMEGGDADDGSDKTDTEIQALADDQKETIKAVFGDEKPTKTTAEAVIEIKTKVVEQEKTIEALKKEPEASEPKKVVPKGKVIPITGGKTTEKYLFGIEAPLFAMDKPWNIVAATRRPLEVFAADKGMEGNWEEYESDFKKALGSYAKTLANRMGELQAEGKLGSIKMQDIDFTGFDNTGWGEEYIIRRQDALIAYIRTLNSIAGIFPTRYGVQNKEVLTNAFLTSFSQSFQGGRVFKGGASVEPIEAEVFDLMFKHKFSNLKELEKEYIGYLNREGSDPMKWTWIEWMLARILEVLMNEWNERRILGCRVEPTLTKAGHHLHGSTGVIRKLLKWAWNDFRLQPFTAYTTYTKSTVLTYVESFVEDVNKVLPSLKGMVLHVNEKHLPWYNAAFRAAYALQQDYSGNKSTIMNYPDVSIQGVPNMGNLCFMWLTMPGNIELIENKAGEMAKIGMQRDLEELMVYSYWKEGVNAIMVGKKFATLAALTADNYQNQYIFMTDPTIALAANATTCDASKGMFFQTIANAVSAPTITDITNAVAGIVYRITCGSATYPSVTAKSGKFSLVDAWIPTAVGDYLEVYLYLNRDDSTDASNNKFVEVGRKVTT